MTGKPMTGSGTSPDLIHRLFEKRADSAPEDTALIFRNRRISYGELNRRANQLAGHLRDMGVEPGKPVALHMERSAEAVVGLLAVHKAGGVYVPIDADYPPRWIERMIREARPFALLTKSRMSGELGRAVSCHVDLDRDRDRVERQGPANIAAGPGPNDLSHILFTSGSTGTPKGVCVRQASLSHNLAALQEVLQIQPEDNYLQTASFAFTSSLRQVLLPMTQGATLIMADAQQRKDPLTLLELVKEFHLTILDLAPSLWRSCIEALEGLDADSRGRLLKNMVHTVLSAGEVLDGRTPARWSSLVQRKMRLYNAYGQTETIGNISLHRIRTEARQTGSIPIGPPVAGNRIHLLDRYGRPVPDGEAGEIAISGTSLAAGYLNQPERTAERFREEPSEGGCVGRVYRTGDLGKRLADGTIVFLGRNDLQLSLRGFRIEPEEIEQALVDHPAVREAVVALKPIHGSPEHLLVAYCAAGTPAPADDELHRFLAERLPGHMIPARYVALTALPRLPNGKIDRQGLPAPGRKRPRLDASFLAPETPLETIIAGIWSEVLKTEPVGAADNFFYLGGNSLLAARLAARINDRLGIRMPLGGLFEEATVTAMAFAVLCEIAESGGHGELNLDPDGGIV